MTDRPDAAHVAHHFQSAEQQASSGKLGMWVFLATEILMFGGLFCGYAVWRHNQPDSFEHGHLLLDTDMGALNTVILITSSFTMAWAVRAAQLGRQQRLVILLAATLAGATGFMVVKYFEYTSKFAHGVAPGQFFNENKVRHWLDADAAHAHADNAGAPPAPTAGPGADFAAPSAPRIVPAGALPGTSVPPPAAPPAGLVDRHHAAPAPADDRHANMPTAEQVIASRRFFDVYFMMTGLHGIHVLVGMGLIAWLLIRAAHGAFGPHRFAAVDNIGLYWHLVDLIWIFLFPLLYLIET
jgi:cytochrome c oxidase subunit 3